jgi:hypothetical protein
MSHARRQRPGRHRGHPYDRLGARGHRHYRMGEATARNGPCAKAPGTIRETALCAHHDRPARAGHEYRRGGGAPQFPNSGSKASPGRPSPHHLPGIGRQGRGRRGKRAFDRQTGTARSCSPGHTRQLPQAGQPFVVVDCAALPPTLVESELFATRRGPIPGRTPAATSYPQAHGGRFFWTRWGTPAIGSKGLPAGAPGKTSEACGRP